MKVDNPMLVYRMADYLGATLRVSKTGDITGKMIRDIVLANDMILPVSVSLKGYILGTVGTAMVKGNVSGNLDMITLVSLSPGKALVWFYDHTKVTGLGRFSPQEMLIDIELAKHNQRVAKFSLSAGGVWSPAKFKA